MSSFVACFIIDLLIWHFFAMKYCDGFRRWNRRLRVMSENWAAHMTYPTSPLEALDSLGLPYWTEVRYIGHGMWMVLWEGE